VGDRYLVAISTTCDITSMKTPLYLSGAIRKEISGRVGFGYMRTPKMGNREMPSDPWFADNGNGSLFCSSATREIDRDGMSRRQTFSLVNRSLNLYREELRRCFLGRHLCPMQFDLADRVIRQMTNPGETVFDPFCGIGTVPLRALKLKRKGFGVELSPGYFRDAVYYCRAAEREIESPNLFDLTESEVSA
jgi:hypothetical protein